MKWEIVRLILNITLDLNVYGMEYHEDVIERRVKEGEWCPLQSALN